MEIASRGQQGYSLRTRGEHVLSSISRWRNLIQKWRIPLNKMENKGKNIFSQTIQIRVIKLSAKNNIKTFPRLFFFIDN